MKCIIIEDETYAAQHMELLLQQIDPSIEVLQIISSVQKSIEWLSENTCDLIFLDVHLGDDISFSIFEKIKVEAFVIFTTAYDQYAIDAFKLNSIDYLLKPVLQNSLREALAKYSRLKQKMTLPDYTKLAAHGTAYQKRFLVQTGQEQIKSISASEIAYFYVQNRYLFITTLDGNQFLFDSNMDTLELKLDPEQFFRINRQFIVSFQSIEEMIVYTRGRIKIKTIPASKEEMIVSVIRANEFRDWLNR